MEITMATVWEFVE